MNVVSDAEALEVLLEDLRREHRALDAQISELQAGVVSDPLTINRLKKRKLQLKDQISRISDQLYPDIIA
ncbi:MAG: YdcH family protein [Pseudomonadota bacterium]